MAMKRRETNLANCADLAVLKNPENKGRHAQLVVNEEHDTQDMHETAPYVHRIEWTRSRCPPRYQGIVLKNKHQVDRTSSYSMDKEKVLFSLPEHRLPKETSNWH